jgi:hypothetical protein
MNTSCNTGFRKYTVSPKIIPIRTPATIKITPRFRHVAFPEPGSLTVTVFPMEEGPRKVREARRQATAEPAQSQRHEIPHWEMVDGEMILTLTVEEEQEVTILVDDTSTGTTKRFAEFRLFALAPDLYSLRPYKGDLHAHSSFSDGLEPPEYVAAAGRRMGFDFMAITDHHRYEPSIRAIEAFSGLDTGLTLFPGEEVHPPGSPIHIVNFGATESVNALFDSEAYATEVRRIETELEGLPEERREAESIYARAAWACGKIRESGGLAIFCHPSWVTRNRYDVPEAATSLMFAGRPFDALELVGGYPLREVESNALQIARYVQESVAGGAMPVVGSSDAHGVETGELFGWYYTVVFARNASELIPAVKGNMSVAVDAVPGSDPRPYGPFRLVRLTAFLFREYFPIHDALCRREGELLLELVGADPPGIDPAMERNGSGEDRIPLEQAVSDAASRLRSYDKQIFG